MRKLLASCAAAALLVGCATQIEKPKTLIESIAYAEGSAQAAIKTIDETTCFSGPVNGVCKEPGRPFTLVQGRALLDKVSTVRTALKQAGTMPDAGGDCLGQTRTPIVCLRVAQALLLEAELVLRERVAK